MLGMRSHGGWPSALNDLIAGPVGQIFKSHIPYVPRVTLYNQDPGSSRLYFLHINT